MIPRGSTLICSNGRLHVSDALSLPRHAEYESVVGVVIIIIVLR